MQVVHEVCCGLDVHKKSVTACVLWAAGRRRQSPRGHDWLPDDINLLQRAGIDVVVSALTAAENEELGLDCRFHADSHRAFNGIRIPFD
jgi:hypothetical protein